MLYIRAPINELEYFSYLMFKLNRIRIESGFNKSPLPSFHVSL